MSESTLSFASSESFRKSLIVRNLQPYSVTGVYTPPSGDITYEYNQSDFSVIDSPDKLIAKNPFANQLYPLNEFGPSGGFDFNINYNGPLVPVKPTAQPYYPLIDSPLVGLSNYWLNELVTGPANQNSFIPDGGFKFLYEVDDLPNLNKYFSPYWDPPTFVPSFYSPYEILTSTNPVGSDGPLSQDSFIARLGAQTLKELFIERINFEIYQNTVGAVNLASLQDPFEASLLITGQQPLVYRNWRITVPENPILAAVDFATRLAGAYWPVSPIPGDYFDENTNGNLQTSQTSTALNVTNNLTGGFLGPILNITRNPSEIFLANTGNGQRSALFNNIDYNRYRPAYDRGLLGTLAQGLTNLLASAINPNNGTLIGGYYVGSNTSEPSQINSPPNQLPINPYGQQVQTPVYGPSELAILYEGNQEVLNFGLAGKSLSDGGGIDGQFVWTSPKYKGNAGYKPTPGGGAGSLDEQFNLVSSNYTRDSSTNIDFKDNSILDQTQRLIESADLVEGIARLKHVGNAINQVSKVFNDGYKEMTKGSKVLSYVDNTTGTQAGIEYCRVFAKDTPYYTYSDLQKTEGITNSGRRFSYSVLDNTFNLNISPTKNPGSTNIIADGNNGTGGYAKKYMFSIENLAWRTSSRPGYTYDELPTCEKGPNGGRVMWFPPYDLKFSDTSKPSFSPTSFLGRPEPIYTYKDTSRSGTLSWTIIVDSPSIMNLIIEKQLKGTARERVDSIIDSFFAGCVKYDIYELAQKFNTIPAKDLYTYQEILNNPQLTEEEVNYVVESIPKDPEVCVSDLWGDVPETKKVSNEPELEAFADTYTNLSFYFDNNVPGPNNGTTSNEDYLSAYNSYVSNKQVYGAQANNLFNTDDFNGNVLDFFDNVITNNFEKINSGSSCMVQDLYKILSEQKGTIVITLEGAASAKATPEYNQKLSERRIDSVIKYLQNYSEGDVSFKKYLEDGSLKINSAGGSGENTTIPVGEGNISQDPINCTEETKDKNGKTNQGSLIYSVSAMACRRVRITSINYTDIPKEETTFVNKVTGQTTTIENPPSDETSGQGITPQFPKPQPTITIEKKLKEGISKKILRNLLSECDYFEVLKQDVPMVYDSIKEKIKYFNPAFHSMTPEGLNARLTFLNQCTRPGETVPTIGADGKPKTNDAINTSFGAPPILILRIGDFYNCKIVPDNIAFTYEPLIYDMNPEGIGLQPMVVKVQMSFSMIGGHGLKEPVDQLQNALSFNYYANTEIYDERSTWTDDSWKVIDKKLIDSIEQSEQPATVANVENQRTNDGGTTIGEIITNIPVESGQTGEIAYQKIMDTLFDQTKGYIDAVPNLLEKIMLNTNQGIVQIISNNRLYSEGLLNVDLDEVGSAPIYGAPNKMDAKIKEIFDKVILEIQDQTNPIISELNTIEWQPKDLSAVITNMVDYINSLSSEFSNGIFTTIQELVLLEQDYVQNLRKINLVADLTDGKIIDKGVPRPYTLSGTDKVSESTTIDDDTITTTDDELWNDIARLQLTLEEYYEFLQDKKIFEPIGDFTADFIPIYQDFIGNAESPTPEKTFFLVVGRIFDNRTKRQEFVNAVIKGDLENVKDPQKLKKKFEDIVDDLAKEYSKEISAEEKLYKDFKKSSEFKDFSEGLDEKLYPKGKTRKFTYTTVPGTDAETQKTAISQLYSGGNTGEDSTYIGKAKFNS
jgi:hypothetical protein